MMPKERGSRSRHRDHRLMKRDSHQSNYHPTIIDLNSSPLNSSPSNSPPPTKPALSSKPSPPTLSSFIPDEILCERIDHLLQKNYTKTDHLTLSTAKAKEYVKEALASQKQVIEQAGRIDSLTSAGFADLKIRAVTIFASIPSQKKATKPSIITFLCHLYLVIIEIQRKSPHPSRFTLLAPFLKFMNKVEREAKELVSAELDSGRKSLLKSKVLSKEEKKRMYLEGGGKKHQHFDRCVKCGHGYVDLPPSNDTLHVKYMDQLRDYQRVTAEWDRYEDDNSNPRPVDSAGKVVMTLPRKPRGQQPILRCHCVQMQWSCSDTTNTCPLSCGGRADCCICRCACSFAWAIVDNNNIVAELAIKDKPEEEYESKRDTVNGWFDSAAKAGTLAADSARATLLSNRRAGLNVSSDLQIERYVEDATNIGTAQFMVRNGPDTAARATIGSQVTALEHPLGRSFIKDRDGNDVNLRPNAAAQRVRNNMLCDVDDIEVIDVASSKCSSVTVERCVDVDVDIEDRAQRLKRKAMFDIKHGSPPTKAIAKRLFREYQNMGRDSTRFADQMELLEMYDESKPKTKAFSTLEAHESFKSIEK